MPLQIPEVDWSQQPGLLGGITRLYNHLMGYQLGNVPQGGMFDASQFNPVTQAADLAQMAANPSQHKLDIAMAVAPLALGGGLRMMRPGAAAPVEAPALRRNLNEVINARDSVYHATDVNGFYGIMNDAAIHPYGAEGKSAYYQVPDPGVSMSRVPSIPSFTDKAINFVIDPKQAPRSRPIAASGYEKTAPEILEMPTKGTIKGKFQVVDAPQEGEIRPNPQFEFENRTFDKPIPLSAMKGIVVDRRALRQAIKAAPQVYWPADAPRPKAIQDQHIDALVQHHLGLIRQTAAAKGLPVRVANSGQDLRSYRTQFSKMQGPLWGGAIATGLASQQDSQ